MNQNEVLYFGQWRYESSTGVLTRFEDSDKFVSFSLALPLKSQKLLLFFLLNPNRLILKGELKNIIFDRLSCTERALFREIGTLRRILGDNSRDPQYILTVRKRGFKFIQPVINNKYVYKDEQCSPFKGRNLIEKGIFQRNFLLNVFFILTLLISLLVTTVFYEYYGSNRIDNLVADNLSDMHGVEWDPAFSPSGLSVAYVNNIEEEKVSNIVLQDLKTKERKYIKTVREEYLNSPVWSIRLDGVFYQRLLPSKICEIRFIKFSKNSFDSIADYFVTSCGVQNNSIKIGIDKDENNLYFSYKAERFSPSFIAKHSLESGIFQKLTSPPQSSFGDYAVALSPDGRSLAFLRDVNRTYAQLWLMSLESGSMKMLYEADDFFPASINWSNDSRKILFSSFYPLVQAFDVIDNHLENIYYSELAVYQVAQNKNGDYILSTGSYWNSAVWKTNNSIDNDKKIESKLIPSNDFDYVVQLNPSELGPTAVVSSRTGKNKLWFYYPDGRKICIDELTLTSHFVHGRFSNDGRKFLVRTGKDLWIVEDSGRLVKVHTEDGITKNFSWSADGLHVFYTASFLGRLRVYKFNINTGKNEALDASIKYFEESPQGNYAIQLRQNDTQAEIIRPNNTTVKVFGLTENALANQRAVLRNGGVYFQYYDDDTDSYYIVKHDIMTDKIEFSDAMQKALVRWLDVSRDEKFFYIHDGVKGNIDLRLLSPMHY